MVVVFVRPLVAVLPRVGEIFDVHMMFDVFPAHTYKCMFIIRICNVLCLSNVYVCSLYEYAMSCVSVMYMYVHYTNMQCLVSQ